MKNSMSMLDTFDDARIFITGAAYIDPNLKLTESVYSKYKDNGNLQFLNLIKRTARINSNNTPVTRIQIDDYVMNVSNPETYLNMYEDVNYTNERLNASSELYMRYNDYICDITDLPDSAYFEVKLKFKLRQINTVVYTIGTTEETTKRKKVFKHRMKGNIVELIDDIYKNLCSDADLYSIKLKKYNTVKCKIKISDGSINEKEKYNSINLMLSKMLENYVLLNNYKRPDDYRGTIMYPDIDDNEDEWIY